MTNNNTDLYNECLEIIHSGHISDVKDKILSLHVSEIIDLSENLPKDKRLELFNLLPNNWYKQYIEWFPDYLIQEIINVKGLDFIISLIKESKDKDFSYHLIKDLDRDEKNQILYNLSSYNRKALETKLNYPKDSAGRLMESEYHIVLQSWNVSQCLHYLREMEKYNKHNTSKDYTLNDIYIIDDQGHPVGNFPLYKLLTASAEEKIVNLKSDNFITVTTTTDQEDVALLFKNRGFTTIGVVDENQKLVGIITSEDIIDVIYKEAEEDFRLASGAENMFIHYKGIFATSFARIRWLCFNIISALTIPFIVNSFGNVLTHYVMIAALIQFVVALGGNAGMQSLSVTIRGLALRTISLNNAFPQIGREFLIALINGTLLGVLGLVWGLFWGHSYIISLIAFISVWINIIIGVTFGTLFPMILTKFKIDPAIASSICVTTSTDICGFFAVLVVSNLLL